jgi:hypothetical protein
MNQFVDCAKRGVELPPGCKDLIDVLRRAKRDAVPIPSTVTIRTGQSLRGVTKHLSKLLRPGRRPKNLVIAWGNLNYTHLTNQGQVLTAVAAVHEDTEREQCVRGAFGAVGLAPVSDEAFAGGAVRVLQYSLSMSASSMETLILDLLLNGYQLAKNVNYELGCWEDEDS